jgi:hypothetical protein
MRGVAVFPARDDGAPMVGCAHDSPGLAMDELTAPLGLTRAPRRVFSLPRAIMIVLGVLLGAGGAVWAVGGKHLFHTKPVVQVPARPQVQGDVPVAPSRSDAPVAPPRSESDVVKVVRDPPENGSRRTVTIIDGMSGKRQDVVIGSPEPTQSAASGQRSP